MWIHKEPEVHEESILRKNKMKGEEEDVVKIVKMKLRQKKKQRIL